MQELMKKFNKNTEIKIECLFQEIQVHITKKSNKIIKQKPFMLLLREKAKRIKIKKQTPSIKYY